MTIDLNARVPPQSVNTERALLGGILFDGSAAQSALDEGLTHGDFYRRPHQLVFEAITSLHRAKEAVDTITVVDWLKERGHLDAVGGPAAVSLLETIIPTSAHVVTYSRIVRDLAAKRRILHSLQGAMDACYEPVDLSVIQRAVTGAFDEATSRAQADVKHVSAFNAAALEMLENKPGSRLPTKLEHVDRLLGGGMRGGWLYVVAARPGMGKSALATEILGHVAQQGVPVLAFTLEMSGEESLVRFWAQDSGVNPRKIAPHEQVKLAGSMGEVSERPIFICDKAGVSLAEVESISRTYVRREGVGLIVVDYLQLMDAGQGENQNQRVSTLSKGLKNLARELGVPVIFLSQLSREVEKRGNRRPQMSDLRDSGSIEQDADVVWLLWRPDYYKQQDPSFKCPPGSEGKVEVNQAKYRNGPTGPVWLRWDGPTFRISDLHFDDYPRT
jgi:replicative DNA helicase